MIIMKIRENQDKIMTIEKQQKELQSVTSTTASPNPVRHQQTEDAMRKDSMKKKTLGPKLFTESRIDEQDNLLEDQKSEARLIEDQKSER